ncbi:hypothetical protein [Mycoplasmopsis gallinarum]|uniref:Uncharacterized protein n=1 Tax=Mycoplasmopsis gallinarum TaxID=29557 RepID=A0A162QHU2_9BACT|nr:hypothetical protein [Mycoplasmopsis gallinarum]OAB48690.1 hypothetical protein MGALLINA_05770 [Mycoplasmopsis gallinarum]
MIEDFAKKCGSKEEEGAPAVVGQLKVSNDLLDFSALAQTNKKAKAKEEITEDNANLTPRERAILARINKKKEVK